MHRNRRPSSKLTRAAGLLFISLTGSIVFGQPTVSHPGVQLGDAPRLHSPPISLSATATWEPVALSFPISGPSFDGNSPSEIRSLNGSRFGEKQQTEQQPSVEAPSAEPSPDETERAINEIRQRVGSVGNRFSDLISPGEAERLFNEALQHARNETPALPPHQPQPHPPAPQPTHPGAPGPHPPSRQWPAHNSPPRLSLPGQPAPPNSLAAWPPGNFPSGNFPSPQPAGAGAFPSALPGEAPFLHHPPGWPAAPQAFPAGPGPGEGAVASPHSRALHLPEPEPQAMRRLARELDRLAEELESIRRYSEADDLRRTAQSFRESVR